MEHVIASGQPPQHPPAVRRAHTRELYDLTDLVRMESSFPWLRVLPVVSDQPGYDGMRGQLPDVMERFHSWTDHDIYICGPTAMVNETVRRLQRNGVPMANIHRDIVQGEP